MMMPRIKVKLMMKLWKCCFWDVNDVEMDVESVENDVDVNDEIVEIESGKNKNNVVVWAHLADDGVRVDVVFKVDVLKILIMLLVMIF